MEHKSDRDLSESQMEQKYDILVKNTLRKNIYDSMAKKFIPKIVQFKMENKEGFSSRTNNKNLSSYEHNYESDFFEVRTMQEDMSFGDIALVKDVPRTATIKCLSDCKFAVMDKKDYEKVLKKLEQQRIENLLDFLSSTPFFSTCSKTIAMKFIRQGLFTEQTVS